MAVQDEGAPLANRATLNFAGSGVVATDDSANNRTNVTIAAGGHVITDELVALPARAKLSFAGDAVLATDDAGNDRTVVTIPGTLVADEGIALPYRAVLNFVGAGVTVTDDPANNRLIVTIAGGGTIPPPATDTYLSRTGWTAVASGIYGAGFEGQKTLDDNIATIWHSPDNAGAGTYITIDMQTAQAFDFVDFIPRQDTRTDPKLVVLEVSTDGSAWTDSSNAWLGVSSAATKRIGASAQHNCRYLRLRFVTAQSVGAACACAELKPGLAGTPGALYDFAPHNMTASNTPSPYVVSGSASYTDAQPWEAFDGNHGFSSAGADGCWLGEGAGVCWLQIDIGSGNTRILRSYAINTNADGGSIRTPKTWTMLGSNDGSAWDTLDTVASETAWGAKERRVFTCDAVTVAYRWFRLNITANNGDPIYTQIGELELFALRV